MCNQSSPLHKISNDKTRSWGCSSLVELLLSPWEPSPALRASSAYHSTVDVIVLSCPRPPQPSAFEEKAIEKVDDLLESYMGIRDTELGEWGTHPCLQGGSGLPGLTQAELSLHLCPS
jgi:hypothetical protein